MSLRRAPPIAQERLELTADGRCRYDFRIGCLMRGLWTQVDDVAQAHDLVDTEPIDVGEHRVEGDQVRKSR